MDGTRDLFIGKLVVLGTMCNTAEDLTTENPYNSYEVEIASEKIIYLDMPTFDEGCIWDEHTKNFTVEAAL